MNKETAKTSKTSKEGETYRDPTERKEPKKDNQK